MRKFKPDEREAMDKVTKRATAKQLFRFVLWDVFRPRRRDKMMEFVLMGMAWKPAFERVSKMKYKSIKIE